MRRNREIWKKTLVNRTLLECTFAKKEAWHQASSILGVGILGFAFSGTTEVVKLNHSFIALTRNGNGNVSIRWPNSLGHNGTATGNLRTLHLPPDNYSTRAA